jgi:hypothetical protein
VLAAQALDAEGHVVGEEIVREGRSGTLVLPASARTLLVVLTRVPLDYDARADDWTTSRVGLKLVPASPAPRALTAVADTELVTAQQTPRSPSTSSGCSASLPYMFPILLLRRRKRC